MKMPELTFGDSEDLTGSHLNTGLLEKFAKTMTEKIIQSLISEVVGGTVNFGVSRGQKREALAEELASAVVEVALHEVFRGQNVQDHFQSSRSVGTQVNLIDHSENKRDSVDEETQVSQDPPSQTGLPIMGSLDYPDAPPTTPLLPELERSRESFTRKLKSGLATVFLPSPPPPTPKDTEDEMTDAALDPRVELMEHLMLSLTTEDLAEDCYEERPQGGTKMEVFAERLSCDIINWVLRATDQLSDEPMIDIHLLAHRLSEIIITSSLDEARGFV